MKIDSKIHPKAQHALLFFSGWGSIPEAVQHLEIPLKTDLFVFYDYREVVPDNLPDLSHYSKVTVVGWSMGVWAIAVLREYLPEDAKLVAVCGTPYPKHNEWGIPIPIFLGTLKNLNDENRAKFNRRTLGGKSLKVLYDSFSKRPTEELKEELLNVSECQASLLEQIPEEYRIDRAPSPFCFAWIASKDLVIPTSNQIAYWSHVEVPYTILEGYGHYPFLFFKSWDEVIAPAYRDETTDR